MRPPRSAPDRLEGTSEATSTTLAADVLEAVLAALPAAGTSEDDRVRRALAAARTALRRGRDPLEAVRRSYAA